MGEAKRKRAVRESAVKDLAQVDLARVAAAVRKLFSAASAARGIDCSSYAMYGQQLLQRLDVAAEVAIGYANENPCAGFEETAQGLILRIPSRGDERRGGNVS